MKNRLVFLWELKNLLNGCLGQQLDLNELVQDGLGAQNMDDFGVSFIDKDLMEDNEVQEAYNLIFETEKISFNVELEKLVFYWQDINFLNEFLIKWEYEEITEKVKKEFENIINEEILDLLTFYKDGYKLVLVAQKRSDMKNFYNTNYIIHKQDGLFLLFEKENHGKEEK